jgi:serine/threonine protein kinase
MADRTPNSAFAELEDLLLQADRASRDFTEAWRTGEPPRIEAFLPSADSIAFEFILLSLIGIERRELNRRGRASRLEDWLARFPGSSELIRDHWSTVSAMAKEAGEGSSSSARNIERRAIRPARLLGGRIVLEPISEGRTCVVHRCAAIEGETDSVFLLLREAFLQRFSPEDRETWLSRWEAIQREIQSASPLGVTKIFDVGRDHEQVFLRVEKCDGGILDRFTSRSIEPLAIANAIESAAAALEAAHAMGFVHGGLRPSKLLRKAPQETRISGLGFVKAFGTMTDSWRWASRGRRTWMAPELIASCGDLSPACDIYSLAAVLYQLLAGRAPYGDLDSGPETVGAAARPFPTAQPIPLRRLNPAVNKGLERLVLQSLDRKPAKRPAGFGVFLDELRTAIGDRGGRKSFGGWWRFWA